MQNGPGIRLLRIRADMTDGLVVKTMCLAPV